MKGWSDYRGLNSDGKGNMTIYSKNALATFSLHPNMLLQKHHIADLQVWLSPCSSRLQVDTPTLRYLQIFVALSLATTCLWGVFQILATNRFPNLGLVDRMANHSKRNWECILLGSINQSSNMKMSPFNTTTMKTFQWKRARPSKIVK